ncbi:hypothetical protein VTK26DRAFT_5608 [Humicola hyalothermophila]
MAPLPQMPQPFSPVQPDQLFRWNGVDANGFVDPGAQGVNSFAMMPTSGPYGPGMPAPSTALARRQSSRALVPSGARTPFDRGADSWGGYGEEPGYLQAANSSMDEHDNIERLEEMAQRAKREAQAKRKQIPPFVQKLSSFLDESRNTDLIRWSDKGDSFIVLDEDEFAKTLIPELFKHNNYASFVRQLNMYGFHKRVGLSDNSMKASERKNKSPSEYYNPYFRRGHPNLLWLINKPKSGSSKKKGKKEENEAESEEDGVVDETYNGQSVGAAQGGRGAGSGELGPLQKKDLIQVRSQIERIQQQQVAISNLLNKMRQDQNQLYQQAVLFQNMHERHENSINAILNFLANVFRKSLEEQGGTQSVQDLLASIIPNAQGHGQSQMSPSVNVVDIGGFFNQRPQTVTSVGTPKRQQRLLPPIPHHQASKVSSLSPSVTPPVAPSASHQAPQMGTVTELFDTSPGETAAPAYIENELRSNPQEGMMKIIQGTNAANPVGIDLPDVAAKTPASMNDDQRTKMLNIMAGSAPPNPSIISTEPSITAPAQAATSVAPSPSIPTTSPSASSNPVSSARPSISLSPGLSTIPLPPLHEIQATQAELDELQRLQNEQASQIDELTSLLGPLSPSGRIPGLDEHGNPNTNYFDNVDYDQFINSNAFADPTATGTAQFDPANSGATAGTGASGFDVEDGGLGGLNHGGAANGTDGPDFNFSLDGSASATDYSGLPAGDASVNGNSNNNSSSGTASVAGTGGAGAGVGNRAPASRGVSPSTADTEEVARPEVLQDSPERGTKRRRKG